MNVSPKYLTQNGCDKAAAPDGLTSSHAFSLSAEEMITYCFFPKQAERSATYWNVSKRWVFLILKDWPFVGVLEYYAESLSC